MDEKQQIEMFRRLDEEVGLVLSTERYTELLGLVSPEIQGQWADGLITSVELLMALMAAVADI